VAQEIKRTSGRTLDHVAEVYDILSPLMLFGMEGRLSRPCLQLLEAGSIRSVLDVGCGTGTLTIEVAKRLAGREGSRVTGMDAAPRMIDVARRKAKDLANIRFDIGIAEELPYASDSFDYVFSTFFFHHIEYSLKAKALNEMWRVLKKGCPAVIIDVDTPTNFFGRICAWSGYFLFQQEEIRENIEGRLRDSIDFQVFSRHMGYISVFKMIKS
jgi:ubiquinone/menaquinone biosynthesis C-methylase UbiE